MNSAFFRFRIRQLGKFVREVPVVYLIIMTGLLVMAAIALYQFTAELKGCMITAGVILALLALLQLRRKDYHFILLAEEKPWKVFCMDYILLSIPFFVVTLLHTYWYIVVGFLIGCLGISFIKQPVQQTKRGITPPRWIPAEAFEIRSGIRQHGGILLILYLSAWAGLFFPFASLASLWFFTIFFSDMFRYSEPEQILFAQERSAKRFLSRKMIINLKIYLSVTMPVCLVYIAIYPAHWWLILSFSIALILNITLFITTKYTYYWPNTKISAGQVPAVIGMVSIFLPVLLPVIVLFLIRYYLAACRNLKTYLYAYN